MSLRAASVLLVWAEQRTPPPEPMRNESRRLIDCAAAGVGRVQGRRASAATREGLIRCFIVHPRLRLRLPHRRHRSTASCPRRSPPAPRSAGPSQARWYRPDRRSRRRNRHPDHRRRRRRWCRTCRTSRTVLRSGPARPPIPTPAVERLRPAGEAGAVVEATAAAAEEEEEAYPPECSPY